MKTFPALSLADIAHVVNEIIDAHSPRFVAVVIRPETPGAPAYGFSNRGAFHAIVEAVGMDAANNLVADSESDSGTYQYDENFGRDTYRLRSRNESADVLAILIRA
jgi:hypothetical protein